MPDRGMGFSNTVASTLLDAIEEVDEWGMVLFGGLYQVIPCV